MRRYVFLLLTMVTLVSCNKTTYQAQIIMKNETNGPIIVRLFPKAEYMSGNYYSISDIGSGYRETEIPIDSGTEMELYITGDTDAKPYAIAGQVFDSIIVVNSAENNSEIRFSPGSVAGYADNLYDEDTGWRLELREYDLHDSFRTTTVKSHDYIFTISDDKIIPAAITPYQGSQTY